MVLKSWNDPFDILGVGQIPRKQVKYVLSRSPDVVTLRSVAEFEDQSVDANVWHRSQ